MNNIKLNNVRLSFNSIFEPEDYENNGVFSYNAKFIIRKDAPEAKQLQDALLQTANEAFDGKGKEVIKKITGDKMQFCLADFDDEHLVLTTKRKAKVGRPVVVDQNRQPLTEADGKPYSGCFVNAIVRPWAMSSKGRHWVRCGLEGVQFAKDGEPFTKRVSGSDFDDLSTDGGFDDGSDLL